MGAGVDHLNIVDQAIDRAGSGSSAVCVFALVRDLCRQHGIAEEDMPSAAFVWRRLRQRETWAQKGVSLPTPGSDASRRGADRPFAGAHHCFRAGSEAFGGRFRIVPVIDPVSRTIAGWVVDSVSVPDATNQTVTR
jgi:hypothetical protein